MCMGGGGEEGGAERVQQTVPDHLLDLYLLLRNSVMSCIEA